MVNKDSPIPFKGKKVQNISLPQLDLSKSKSKTAQSDVYAQGTFSGHSIIVMAFTDFFMKLALSPIKKN